MRYRYVTPCSGFANSSLGDLSIFPHKVLLKIGKNATTQTLARLCTVNRYFHRTFNSLTYSRGALDCQDQRPSRNPAVWAIRHHCVPALEKLLQHGLKGDTWVWITSYPPTNVLEESLLHLAIKSWRAMEMKDLRIVRLLVGYGADVNGKDMKFDTPLSLASYSDWGDQMKALVQLLLEFGAGISINEGGTIHDRPPLHWAARHGDIEIVAILLKYGADVRVKDGDGFTAFKLAMQEGHQEIMNLLES
jgi:hypothetical protein